MSRRLAALCICCFCAFNFFFSSSVILAQNTNAKPIENALVPNLSVDIPGVTFSEVLKNNGVLQVNFLGEYIAGFYRYLLGIGTTIAIIFIMVAGLRYTLAAGGGDVKEAQSMIRNAVVGLTLLLSVYAILFIINPELTKLKSLNLLDIESIALDAGTSGEEGVVTSSGRTTCDKIVETAKSEGTCNISQSVISPTGNKPNCGRHHWFDRGANGEYTKITNLDYAASWGTSIKAPFDGTVTYKKSITTSNRCGNTITLTGTGKAAGAKISICHAKDFLNDSGAYLNGQTITQGAVIGHLGGNCCTGEKPPDTWDAAKNGWCKVSGTMCTDPTKSESCSCQPIEQAGNTSGPHVHMTWQAGGDLLACIDY